MKRILSLFFGIAVPCLILLLPLDVIPIVGITIVEKRLLAIFAFAIIFWVFEPIPVFAASVCVIFLEMIMISDGALIWLRSQAGSENFGILVPYKDIFHTFASPIILLFLGGFFLAMAATKYKLDINLARVLLKPFGKRPAMVMLGVMMITALFSMFMSNTATTAMMLAIIAPVLALFDPDDPGKIAMAMAVPFAANIGGLGTPIGTPPNVVAMKYLTGDMAVSFSGWMAFAVPYVIVLLIFAWIVLLFFYQPAVKEINLQIKGQFMKTPKAVAVYITFGATILLWLFGSRIGLNSYIVAMIPITVFTAGGIITASDMKKMSWDVLWLLSGGIALGVALAKTGLSQHLIASIPFDQFTPWTIVAVSVLFAMVMATFMSNTATANLILPIIAMLGASLLSLGELGGAKMIIIATTFGCSLAMLLPVSTPPNALAYATGFFKTKHMIKAGIVVDMAGYAMIFCLIFVLNRAGFFEG
ncbi:MAG: SLC13/DASS family transporter [Candidatus Omnitrophica bacterium]|nr:SLC13/DASS family transporter [Candidatus Omnitrophota bacterium]